MKKIYLLALLFAVLTGAAVWGYARHLESSLQIPKGFVVAAAAKISANTLITPDMVKLIELPEEAVNPLAVRRLEAAVGRITNAGIEAGEPILSPRINERGKDAGGLAFAIPQGKRAIAVAVTETSGTGFYIRKSDRVDIIAMVMMDKLVEDKIERVEKSVLLLQDVEVLQAGPAVKADSNSGYTSITVAVTPEEAVKLFYVQTAGKLTAVLRPVLSEDTVSVAPYEP